LLFSVIKGAQNNQPNQTRCPDRCQRFARLPAHQRAAKAGTGAVTLDAAPARVQLAPPALPQTKVCVYNAQVPGQTLRYTRGDTLDVRWIRVS